MYEAIAFAVTFFVSTFGVDFFRRYVGYLDLSVCPVIAVCVMGTFILWAIRHPKNR